MIIMGQKGGPNSQLGVHVYIVILFQGDFNEEEESQFFKFSRFTSTLYIFIMGFNKRNILINNKV